jgi:hypothetical protein
MPSTLILMPLCKLGRPKAAAAATMRGAAGVGLVGRVVFLLASSQLVSAGFAFYGVGWSIYSHAVAPGSDVTFARNSPMEIRFATHEDPSPIETKPDQQLSVKPALAQP